MTTTVKASANAILDITLNMTFPSLKDAYPYHAYFIYGVITSGAGVQYLATRPLRPHTSYRVALASDTKIISFWIRQIHCDASLTVSSIAASDISASSIILVLLENGDESPVKVDLKFTV